MSLCRSSVNRGLAWFLIVTSGFLSLSCDAQKRAGKEVASRFKPPAVLLMFPDFVFKKNSDSAGIENFARMNGDQKDSALYYGSRYIQYVDDSLLLSCFQSGFTEELRTLGFRVFSENKLDSFLTLGEKAFVLTLVQAELDENVEPFTDSEMFDDTMVYYKRFDLKSITMNSWFEIRQLNAADSNQPVLFSSFFVSDQVKGRFWKKPLIQEVGYKYKHQEVRLEDVFGLAEFSGRKNASYWYDYLLNKEIAIQTGLSDDQRIYWHYNRLRNNLRPAGDDKFVPVQ